MKKVKEATIEPKVEPYKSKTLWAAIINTIIVKFIPGASEWIAQNPEAYAQLLGLIFVILRNFTAGEMKWKFWKKTSNEKMIKETEDGLKIYRSRFTRRL